MFKTTTGAISSLYQNEMDVAIGPFTLTAERRMAVEFLPTIDTETFALYTKRPTGEEVAWNVYTMPFHVNVWIAVLFFALILALFHLMAVLFCSLKSETKDISWSQLNVRLIIEETYTAFFIIIASYVSLFLDAKLLAHIPDSNYNRIFTFVCLLCGLVLFASYNASLTSELSVEVIKPPFTDPYQLANDQRFTIVTSKNPNNPVNLAVFKTRPFDKIFKERMLPNYKQTFYRKLSGSIRAFHQSSNPVFLTTAETFENYINQFMTGQELCKFLRVWTSPISDHTSFMVRKNLPLKYLLHSMAKRFIQRGNFAAMKKRWKPKSSTCPDKLVKPLGVEKCGSLLLSLVTAFLISIFILLMEQLSKRFKHEEKKKLLNPKPQMNIIQQLNQLTKEEFILTVKEAMAYRRKNNH